MRRLSLRANPGGFLADFDAATVVCPFSTKRGYLRMFPDVPISIGLTHEDGDTYVSLEMFEAHPGVRGTGAGTEAMRRILDLADKYGLSVYLDPHPLDEGWSWERLVKWYASFGFAFEEEDAEDRKQSGNYWMQRLPHAKGTRRPNPRQRASDFARWFGASKVVDEQGQPLVVYHGTAYTPGQSRIEHFRGAHQPFRYPAWSGRSGKVVGIGSFFSESAEVAASYPVIASEAHTRVVHPIYLRIEKPKAYRTIRAVADDMVARVGSDPVAFVDLLRSEGYDGVTFMEGPSYAPANRSKKARVWVTFTPEQVRHADTRRPNPRTRALTRALTRSRR